MGKVRIYLALGSNLGDRLQTIESGMELLKSRVSELSISKIYETEPWGITDQPAFLNACVGGFTTLSPTNLLKFIKEIEITLGRKKRIKWGPRELDIDILFYGERIINESDLVIPHPFLHQRSFALVPLKDLAPDFIHPVIKKSISSLLEELGNEELPIFLKK
jgi:2-amino-4-hydroxy-6-hydroxymethyldihydropteridine diphosphokinase